jgi:hypothetical protein
MKQLVDSTPAHSTTQWAMRPQDTERRFLNVREVARYCGVVEEEVFSWIDAEELIASRVAIGRYRIAVGDQLAFLDRLHPLG